jgi:hypothetical protein
MPSQKGPTKKTTAEPCDWRAQDAEMLRDGIDDECADNRRPPNPDSICDWHGDPAEPELDDIVDPVSIPVAPKDRQEAQGSASLSRPTNIDSPDHEESQPLQLTEDFRDAQETQEPVPQAKSSMHENLRSSELKPTQLNHAESGSQSSRGDMQNEVWHPQSRSQPPTEMIEPYCDAAKSET